MAENTYLTALHGMEELILDARQFVPMFSRKNYSSAFQKYYEAHTATFQAVETGYQNAIDKTQYVFNMAQAAVTPAAEAANKPAGKSKKEKELIDCNLSMVVYVFPAILYFKGESAGALTDEMLRQWKEQFPKTNLSAAPYEDIESGFHKKWCYITTAVCETFGKPDDCYELTVLRNYRDSYLQSQPDGEEIIREYYDVAPTIVKHINRQPDRKEIYRSIWDTYLNPCLTMIENDEKESCRELYTEMVRTLQERYFYTDRQKK
ncbi:hypothetical protein BRYFOR_06297 [Marvinbryantia formatexigens DSM 14469]|uniref:Uncharacterized protein n=1 Tax=Marvinbryantia formatexigens DSM 14469 TaxID=478749 RepID=C6LCF0_9FIRM|nr:CFI-box-CTERM domain-containing protein [Marvinbryantia formatexigens]EET61614.1 hypothetical protein BRYFOR_06297 [Marvinbryantia formatexigens DSM 14469]UWO24560.1 hypothetical protein NQ534_19435 [Marvinbryantia formatexigens DSM 14469]SDF13237.1 hypothetical protein SAMN05660368_00156 [Marvinbryantia formatexigens]